MRLRQMGFCFLSLQSLLPDAHLIVVSPVIGEKSCWMVTVSLEKNICLKCQVWQQSLPAYLDEERCFVILKQLVMELFPWVQMVCKTFKELQLQSSKIPW